MKTLALLLVLAMTSRLAAAVSIQALAPQGRPLALSANEVAEHHGLILRGIARGELDDGLARLDALWTTPQAAPMRERIEQDIARCRGLIDLRARHISELIEKRKHVTLERVQDKLTATVTKFEDGKLTLEGAKAGPKVIAADELKLMPLVRGLSPATLEGVDVAVRGYAFVLAGDAKGIATLKGSPAADELRVDAESFYPRALHLGAAAELLTNLARAEVPVQAEQAAAIARWIEELMGSFRDYELVSTRRPALAALGLAANQLLFDETKVTDGLSAAVERLPDGRTRLTYEFKKSRPLTDFIGDHGYLKDIRDQFEGPRGKLRDLVAGGGILRAGGDGVWRHVLDFTGPVRLECTYAYDQTEDPPTFVFGLHDDRADSLVMCQAGRVLLVRDIPTRLAEHSPVPPVPSFRRMEQFSFTVTVADGLATLVDGRTEAARIRCGSRSRGNLLLIISGKNDVLFSRLVVEARIDVDGMRVRWAQQRLAELGL